MPAGARSPAGSALAPATAFAQSVEQTNLRYDEDWSVLRDAPREGWRQAKYVPLGDTGDAYLTLGGEARARLEGRSVHGVPVAGDLVYPGLGQATVDAGLRGDIPLLMGIVLFCTLLVFIGNTVASLLLARINRGWEGEHAV